MTASLSPCPRKAVYHARTVGDPMRHAVFDHLAVSPQALNLLSPGVTWAGWLVPLGLSLAMVAAMGLAMLGIAIAEFRKTE